MSGDVVFRVMPIMLCFGEQSRKSGRTGDRLPRVRRESEPFLCLDLPEADFIFKADLSVAVPRRLFLLVFLALRPLPPRRRDNEPADGDPDGARNRHNTLMA